MQDVYEAVRSVTGRNLSHEVCHEVVERLTYGASLSGLDGIGRASERRLEDALALGEHTRIARAARQTTVVTRPEDVAALMEPRCALADREHFWALALDTKNRLLRVIDVSVGSLNASIVHPRELFKEAVKCSAASIVVCHNHPSGDTTPSGADVQLTRRLVKAGDVLGIEVLDHVVLGAGGEHASLRDLGLM